MKVRIEDNTANFLRHYESNKRETLEALGKAGVKNQIVSIDAQPKFGGAGIGAVETGLMRDSARSEVRGTSEVAIGNTASSPQGAPYPLFVAIGTHKMPKRPFIHDMIFNFTEEYKQIIEKNMSEGMK